MPVSFSIEVIVTSAMPQGVMCIKRRQIAAHVERETMHRDPMPNPNANRRDLAARPDHFGVLDPDAR